MRIHVFVDGENISTKAFFNGLQQLRLLHKIAKIDVFGKDKPRYIDNLNCNFIKCFRGKNSADTFMTASIVKAVYEEPLTDGFAIFTSDSDFTPAIKVVTDAKKPVFLITEQGNAEKRLKDVCVDLSLVTQVKLCGERTLCSNNNFIRCKAPDKFIQQNNVKSIYIKVREKIYEIPFVNGMDIDTFCRIAPIKEIKKNFPRSTKISEILLMNHIKLVDNCLYVDLEGIDNELFRIV